MTRQLRTRGVSGSRATSGGLLLLTWLAAHGCGDDEKPTYAHRRDSGVDDAGMDAGERDAGGDAQIDPEVDGSTAGRGGRGGSGGGGRGGSGGGGRGGTSGGGTGGGAAGGSGVDPCEISEDDNTFVAMTPGANDGRFAVTTGATGFGVAFEGPAPMDCAARSTVQVLPVQASGAFATPTTLVGDCSTKREISLLKVGQGWRMVWVDNSSDFTAELQSALLDDTLSAPVGDLRTRLTNNKMLEERPVLATVGGVPLVAFLATTAGTGSNPDKTRIQSLRLDGQATVQDVVSEGAARKPVTLALTQIGANDAVLAWVDEEAKPGVWSQRVDLNGTPKGEPDLLTDIVGGGSTVDIAPRPGSEGGAIIYSINVGGANSEVRFRRLSNTGTLLGDEVKVVGAPLQGSDASIARLGGGYVVAYRALPGGPITQSEIRIAFISPEGNIATDATGAMVSYKVADADSGGGRTVVRVSNDGQLLIGYVDYSDAGTVLRLVRRRLDCAL